MANNPKEPQDGQIYYWVSVYPETFFFLKKALTFYRDLLKRELEALSLDEELKQLISARPEQAKVVESEIVRINRLLTFYEEQEKKEGANALDYSLGDVSHRMIRYIKSVALLYLAHLRNRRNEITKRRNLSKHILKSIDEEIARRDESLQTSGIFAKATPIELLVDQTISVKDMSQVEDEPSLTNVQQPQPVLLDTIPILDPLLKERCMDLFSIFNEKAQHERFDTVLSDATRILEDRMRSILGVTGKTGDEMSFECFGGPQPKLRVSTISAEQQGVLLLFKGIFSHIRNPVHHTMNASFTPERTLQIMGLVDYAIHVLETAEREEQKP